MVEVRLVPEHVLDRAHVVVETFSHGHVTVWTVLAYGLSGHLGELVPLHVVQEYSPGPDSVLEECVIEEDINKPESVSWYHSVLKRQHGILGGHGPHALQHVDSVGSNQGHGPVQEISVMA